MLQNKDVGAQKSAERPPLHIPWYHRMETELVLGLSSP